MRIRLGPMLLALSLLATPAAHAASSAWVETDGGRVRLVTAGRPGPDGVLRGVLDIELKPGWKTYWRDPGDAGVPPSIDISRSANLASAELDFPAPSRHDEGDFTWAGYDRPVALPVTFRAGKIGDAVSIDADIFLGICQTICIPVRAELTVDPTGDANDEDDGAFVKAAFEGLPGAARADFQARALSRTGSRMTIGATLPGDASAAQIFIAGSQDFSLNTPVRADKQGAVIFEVDIDGPDPAPAGTTLHYTLVGETGAVSGVLSAF